MKAKLSIVLLGMMLGGAVAAAAQNEAAPPAEEEAAPAAGEEPAPTEEEAAPPAEEEAAPPAEEEAAPPAEEEAAPQAEEEAAPQAEEEAAPPAEEEGAAMADEETSPPAGEEPGEPEEEEAAPPAGKEGTEGSALDAPADVAAPPADAQKSESGLAWKVLREGTGARKPGATDRVMVHYTGWTTEGKMFDSSVKRGKPSKFPLDGVIKGWTEGLQMMAEGGKRRFWIPADLAYGEDPGGGRPGGMLVFDVELLRVLRPHPTPENIAGPPEDAPKTDSGLVYKVIEEGEGPRPKGTDRVKVHFTGWTTDGKVFASSLTNGEPQVLPLNRCIRGWFEGVQMMRVGGTRRFWIPAGLAYGDSPPLGAPKGMLVFDIELLDIAK